ncbi:hypothetical protein Lalb_Chr24g0401131 [Lupinus albus]|uniref:Uncharacterized protein n=1 Tax=Lupinus albus TaxID=3870 RepID=A0A6A4MS33_LUPAL|nr:hypothetical protein Lalb_Chr24g0401131 [Lupinus albus]
MVDIGSWPNWFTTGGHPRPHLCFKRDLLWQRLYHKSVSGTQPRHHRESSNRGNPFAPPVRLWQLALGHKLHGSHG